MLNDLNPDQRTLAESMSDISERCYHSGWQQDLEYVLWDAVIKGERKYGQDFITSEDIETLKHLSDQAGCWIIFDDVTEETAIDLAAWSLKYESQKHTVDSGKNSSS